MAAFVLVRSQSPNVTIAIDRYAWIVMRVIDSQFVMKDRGARNYASIMIVIGSPRQ